MRKSAGTLIPGGNELKEITNQLRKVHYIDKVYNIIISETTGSPVESVGIGGWGASIKCSSFAKIFNVAEQLHKSTLSYIFLNAQVKFLVVPLRNLDSNPKTEFFITVTIHPDKKLEPIFLELHQILNSLPQILEDWKAEFYTPLRTFQLKLWQEEVDKKSAWVEKRIAFLKKESFSNKPKITPELSSKIQDLVSDYSKSVGVISTCVFSNEDQILCKCISDPSIEAAKDPLAFALFDTVKRSMFMVGKPPIISIRCECTEYYHYIHAIDEVYAVSTFISKSEERPESHRLALSQYIGRMVRLMHVLE